MPLYNQGVTSITPSDTTLTIPTTTGAVSPAVNQAAEFNWGAAHSWGGVVTIDPSAAIQLDVNTNFTVDDSGNAVAVTVTVQDDPYSAAWGGSTEVPTKSAVYDKIEAIGTGFTIENRTSDPGSPAVGQIWLRTDL